MPKIYVGDIGTDIILDTGMDLAGATTLKMKYKKPNAVIGEWTGTVTATTKIKHTSLAGELDVAGKWVLQAYVVIAGWTGHGESVNMTVYSLFE